LSSFWCPQPASLAPAALCSACLPLILAALGWGRLTGKVSLHSIGNDAVGGLGPDRRGAGGVAALGGVESLALAGAGAATTELVRATGAGLG
jgi:hypothetical protein